MTKEIFTEYAEKLKRVKDDKKFIVGQMVTTYGDDEARYMIDYIDSIAAGVNGLFNMRKS